MEYTTKVNWDFGAFHTNNVGSFLKFERKKNHKNIHWIPMLFTHFQQMILYLLLWDFMWKTLYINTYYMPNSFIVQFCSLQTYTTHQFHKVYKERLERLWIIHEFFEPSSKLFCLWNKPKSSAGQLNSFFFRLLRYNGMCPRFLHLYSCNI